MTRPANPDPGRLRRNEYRAVNSGLVRRPPSPRQIARRRRLVGLAKIVLPLFAFVLLASVALWQEVAGVADGSRFSYRRVTITPDGGQLTDGRYRGVDAQGQPYVITAVTARQIGPDRSDLVDPKADLALRSGAWVMVQARQGVFLQKQNQLDLSGDVTLFRDDGTSLITDAAAFDLQAGAAAGSDQVHAEGPFGVLDAQGFFATDGGAVLHFTGPAHLVLNAVGTKTP